MPVAEVEISEAMVRALFAEQRPDLADRELTHIAFGWDNVSYRVGDDLVARFPRRALAVPLILNEARWLPELAPSLPLPVPVPVYDGRPGAGYPWPWSLTPLIPGVSAALASFLDLNRCADQLGAFLVALHRPAPADAPENRFRGMPLIERDAPTRERLELLGDDIDRPRLERLWEESLSAPVHRGPGVWIHGDLHPHNLLVDGGVISGVMDFGDLTSGDPATDLAIGWSLFESHHRKRFLAAYGGGGDATYVRARGWAPSLGTAYLANSADNPVMHAVGERTVREVLGG